MIHSVAWLGSVLIADPQRLILGLPWYVTAALSSGAVVFLAWIYLAITIGKMPSPFRIRAALFAATYALYFPFLVYWRIMPLT